MRAYAFRNYWRVARMYEPEDLIQDGYMIYAKCRQHYQSSREVTERRHFMALFKTSFTNHIHDLAKKCYVASGPNPTAEQYRGLGNEIAVSSIGPTENRAQWLDSVFGSTVQDSELRIMLSQAKGPVKELIALFTTEAGAATLRARPQRSWETLNMYVCRLIGADDKRCDVPELFKSFLRGTGVYYLRRRATA